MNTISNKCHKTFWDNPYQKSQKTRIQSVNDDIITLNETIFFAFSGGQESDTGTIAGLQVLEAVKNELNIEYKLPVDHGLEVGDLVKVNIDWDRRFQLMRLHFAAETVLELVYATLKGIQKIGAHVAANKARLDFLSELNLKAYFQEWTAQANDLFNQDLPIIKAFSDHQQQRRYWQVEGFAKVPCGGTHINTTGEVGTIHLKRKNIGKGKERIEIYLN